MLHMSMTRCADACLQSLQAAWYSKRVKAAACFCMDQRAMHRHAEAGWRQHALMPGFTQLLV